MKKFYCTECEEPKGRLEVTCDDYKGVYFCNRCGSPVLQTKYVMEDMLTDYIDYIRKHGSEKDYY